MGKGAKIMVSISNAGGTLNINRVIGWKENQTCDVAVKDVPKREDGQVIDTDTWLLRVRKLDMKTRLSNNEKYTLLNIFSKSAKVTITAGDWSYTAWLKTKDIKWDYSKADETSYERPWLALLTFDVESFNYSP